MIYIFIPAYNEWENLPALIKKIKYVMKNDDFKIIVVDDGSTDGTGEKCRETFPDIEILKHPINKGIGEVFRTILDYVKKIKKEDIFCIMEADGTNDPFILPDMVKIIEKGTADIVIGSRYVKGGGYKNFPPVRRILSKGANLIFKLLFWRKIKARDFTIFYRTYKAKIVKEMGKRVNLIESNGFLANAELLVKLGLNKQLEIFEYPLVYDYKKKKGKSKLKIFKNLKEYILFLHKMALVYFFKR